MSIEERYLRLVSGESRGPAAAAARGLLAIAEPGYGAVIAARNAMFDRGLRRVHRLPRPVVSVGNLTTGGTGKTPVVAHLARRLLETGRRPGVLMRGYRARRGEAGDEQRLLEWLLGEAVPVQANPDRVAGAAALLSRRPEVDVLLLDDGFQHRRVAREADVVLIDATRPWGHGRLLPRGLLREPPASLRRATAVLVTRVEQASREQLRHIECAIRSAIADRRGPADLRAPGQTPIFRVRFGIAGFTDAGGAEADLPDAGGRFFAFCGVGNAPAFLAGLRERLGEPESFEPFGDHHHYEEAEIARLARRAGTAPGSPVAVTTGKDWMKLRDRWPPEAPIRIIRQSVEIEDEDALLAHLLERLPLP